MVKSPEKDFSGYPEGTLFREFGEVPNGASPEPVSESSSADSDIDFQAPASARRLIEDAENPRLKMREDILEHQVGGRFAAKISTRGVKAVTGRLPGETVPRKTEKPKNNRPKKTRRGLGSRQLLNADGPPPGVDDARRTS